MAYAFFFAYLIALLWAIPRIPFFRKAGLRKHYLQGLFLIKALAGVAYGYFHAQRGGGDTWVYHRYGLEDLQILRSDPILFLTSIKNPGYITGYGEFFGTANSWWNDLDGHVFGKMLAVAHLLSGSNYYINSLFFNLFSLGGLLLLYRVWQHSVPIKKSLLALAPFLVPSFIFWSSGIHKEGMLVLALGLLLYAVYFGVFEQKWGVKRVAAIVIGLLIVLVMRNYLLLPLLLGLVAFAAAKWAQPKIRPLVTYCVLFFIAGLLFFSAHLFLPGFNLPKVVIDRQEAFSVLRSPNRFASLALEPNALSFVQHAPQALYNAGFRPMIWEANNAGALLSAIEAAVIIVLCAFALWRIQAAGWRNSLLLFCLFFSVASLLIIGYTVVFPGAIVRYRSVVLPLMLMPVMAQLLRQPAKHLRNNQP
ncbi:hypothetical protein [Paracnuella aquatica]|uniref:hypothetical protein n=1 Tax=Paracnuella aquatica TaxID=2268757 RepID=UPI000DEEFC12|nr:hypothetical protein [Paracnuella aquatica]RPD49156.1 hypothetical protein DRJ53_08565 [Paracnuella aquatica]